MNTATPATPPVSHGPFTSPPLARRAASMTRSTVRDFLRQAAQPGMISFAGGLPAPELFPLEEIAEATRAVWEQQGAQALQYGESEGVVGLRDWVAARFSTASRPRTREHVVITSGAQEALHLLGLILIDEGDEVWVENPTYLALLQAWRTFGARFRGVPGDAHGLQAHHLPAMSSSRPKALYLIPNFQNPQGTTLSLARRRAVCEWAGTNGAVVVEDDAYGELRYEGEALPHLLTLCPPDVTTCYVGTFSKVLAPGLRVGWVVGPPRVIEKLVQARQAVDLHTSTLTQHLVLELVGRGILDRQIPKLRRAYAERRDAMLAALERHFPAETTWTRPEGGLFLLVTLPVGWPVSDLLRESLSQGVAFIPGEEFHVDASGANTLRLNFSHPSPGHIEEGIRRLSQCLKTVAVAAKT